MDANYFRMLYDYSCWARDRLLAAAQGMSQEEYEAPIALSQGSLRTLLTHALSAEVMWFQRLQGTFRGTRIQAKDVPTLDALAERWRREEAGIRSYLDGLRDADLRGEFVLKRTSGEEVRLPLGYYIGHVVNHGTQHRSEAAEALTLTGRSPGELDLFLYLRECRGGQSLTPAPERRGQSE